METESIVSKVVVDVCKRSFLLISDKGEEKYVECDNIKEFESVLAFCKNQEESIGELVYASPLVKV